MRNIFWKYGRRVSKFGFSRKGLAGATALIFLASTLSAPVAEANFWKERRNAARSSSPTQVAQLPASQGALLPWNQKVLNGLPANPAQSLSFSAKGLPDGLRRLLTPYADIHSFHLAPSFSGSDAWSFSNTKTHPLVVLVQDAHDVPEAQRNIALLLNDYQSQLGLRLVGLEGARGGFQLAPYRALSGRESVRLISDYLLDSRLITGAEHFGLTAPREPSLWGIEDEPLYLSNVDAFRNTLPYQKSVETYEAALAAMLSQLKTRIYGAELKTADSVVSRYADGSLPLPEYVGALSAFQGSRVAISAFPNVAIFQRALELEKALDFQKAEAERNILLKRLTQSLSPAEASGLLNASLSYRQQKIGFGDYHGLLKSFAGKHGISLDEFPQLNNYVDYAMAVDRLDRQKFLEELSGWEAAVCDGLAKSEAQRGLLRLSRDAGALHKLFTHSFTADDWNNYLSHKDRFARFTERLSSLGKSAGVSTESLTELPAPLSVYEDFYRRASDRNETFVRNLSARMKSEGARSALMVAGGFHTDGLRSLLEKRKVSYVVLTPRIAKVDASDRYLDVFARGRTPLEKLMLGEKLFIHAQLNLAAAPAAQFTDAPQSVQRNIITSYLGLEAFVDRMNQALSKVRRNFPGVGVQAWIKSQKPFTVIVQFVSGARATVEMTIGQTAEDVRSSDGVLQGKLGDLFFGLGQSRFSGAGASWSSNLNYIRRFAHWQTPAAFLIGFVSALGAYGIFNTTPLGFVVVFTAVTTLIAWAPHLWRDGRFTMFRPRVEWLFDADIATEAILTFAVSLGLSSLWIVSGGLTAFPFSLIAGGALLAPFATLALLANASLWILPVVLLTVWHYKRNQRIFAYDNNMTEGDWENIKDYHEVKIKIEAMNISSAKKKKLLRRLKSARVLEFDIKLERHGTAKAWRIFQQGQGLPTGGGMRWVEGLTKTQVARLALEMSLKNAIAGVALRGAKGGVSVDPKKLSDEQNAFLMRRYVRALFQAQAIGWRTDKPAPDINTTPQMMAWFMDEYLMLWIGSNFLRRLRYRSLWSKYANKPRLVTGTGLLEDFVAMAREGLVRPADIAVLATVTGKPVGLGGIAGRTQATGYGIMVTTRFFAAKVLGKTLEQITAAIEGFGNVGSLAANELYKKGTKITVIKERNGIIYHPDGLDIPALMAYWNEHQNFTGFDAVQAGAVFYNLDDANQKFWAADVDVVIPAAKENVINAINAGLINAKLVVEGANGPTTEEGGKVLAEKGIMAVPDILANSGGVYTSFLEMIQSIQAAVRRKPLRPWTEEETLSRLEQAMESSCQRVYELAQKEGVPFRDAAEELALQQWREDDLRHLWDEFGVPVTGGKSSDASGDETYAESPVHPVTVKENYEEMSREAADLTMARIRAKVTRGERFVLGLATGATQERFLDILAHLIKTELTPEQRDLIHVVHLDEYVGLPADHEQSYQWFLKKHFLNESGIRQANWHFINGQATALQRETEKYEALIKELGGVDLQLMGIGNNGHIAFNEPGSPFDSRTRVVDLDESTIRANGRFFFPRPLWNLYRFLDWLGVSQRHLYPGVPRQAITQGIGTILEAKELLLLASGQNKAPPVQDMLLASPNPAVPATALQSHNNWTVIITKNSASLLPVSSTASNLSVLNGPWWYQTFLSEWESPALGLVTLLPSLLAGLAASSIAAQVFLASFNAALAAGVLVFLVTYLIVGTYLSLQLGEMHKVKLQEVAPETWESDLRQVKLKLFGMHLFSWAVMAWAGLGALSGLPNAPPATSKMDDALSALVYLPTGLYVLAHTGLHYINNIGVAILALFRIIRNPKKYFLSVVHGEEDADLSLIKDALVPVKDIHPQVTVKSVKVARVLSERRPGTEKGFYEQQWDLLHAVNMSTLSVFPWLNNLGKAGEFTKKRADGAAAYALQQYYNSIKWLRAIMVAGEGTRDEAPMLPNGETLGAGFNGVSNSAARARMADTAQVTDVMELTNGAVSDSVWNSVSIAGNGEFVDGRPGFLSVPDVYMEKWQVSRAARDADIGFDKTARENLSAIASSMGKTISQLRGAILMRPSHVRRIVEMVEAGIDYDENTLLSDLVRAFRELDAARPDAENYGQLTKEMTEAYEKLNAGVKKNGVLELGNLILLADGDLTPVITFTLWHDRALDFVTGRGGTAECVMGTAIVKAIGGKSIARLASAKRLKEDNKLADLDKDGQSFTEDEQQELAKFNIFAPGTELAEGSWHWDHVFTQDELVPANDYVIDAGAIKENQWAGMKAPVFNPETGEFTMDCVRASSSGDIRVFTITYQTELPAIRKKIAKEMGGFWGMMRRFLLPNRPNVILSEALHEAGLIYLAFRQFDEAIDSFGRAAAFAPEGRLRDHYLAEREHAIGMKLLVTATDEKGELSKTHNEDALSYFEKSLALTPLRENSLQSRRIYMLLSDFLGEKYEKAAQALSKEGVKLDRQATGAGREKFAEAARAYALSAGFYRKALVRIDDELRTKRQDHITELEDEIERLEDLANAPADAAQTANLALSRILDNTPNFVRIPLRFALFVLGITPEHELFHSIGALLAGQGLHLPDVWVGRVNGIRGSPLLAGAFGNILVGTLLLVFVILPYLAPGTNSVLSTVVFVWSVAGILVRVLAVGVEVFAPQGDVRNYLSARRMRQFRPEGKDRTDLIVLPKTDRIPGHEDVKPGELFLGEYDKLYPLTLNFLRLYGGDKPAYWELRDLADVLENTEIAIGETQGAYFDLDRDAGRIVLNREFLDFLFITGRKKVLMSLVAGALAKLKHGDDIDTRALEILVSGSKENLLKRRIAGLFPVQTSRLDATKTLFNLTKVVKANDTPENASAPYFLSDQDVTLVISDVLQRGKILDVRRLREYMKKQFGYYGWISEDRAARLLERFHRQHADAILRRESTPSENVDALRAKLADDAKIVFDEETNGKSGPKTIVTYSLNPKWSKDPAFEGRWMVWDTEVGRQDEVGFGGKAAHTGEMMFAPHVVTLPNFFSSGDTFQELFNRNTLDGFRQHLDSQVNLLLRFVASHRAELNGPTRGVPEHLIQELQSLRVVLDEGADRRTAIEQLEATIQIMQGLSQDILNHHAGSLREYFMAVGVDLDKEVARIKSDKADKEQQLRAALKEIKDKKAADADADVVSLERHVGTIERDLQRLQADFENLSAQESNKLLIAARNLQVPDDLVAKMKNDLRLLAQRLDVPVSHLVLAIRSSAVGEDSEEASFAGRQDTYIFVTAAPNGDDPEGLDNIINSWVFNQASLFNKRAIDYRFDQGLPTFDENIQISTLFQVMFLSEESFIAFSVDRETGFPSISMNATEGQGELLVSGQESGSKYIVTHDGKTVLVRQKGDRTWKVVETADGRGKKKVRLDDGEKREFSITDGQVVTDAARYFRHLHDFYEGYVDLEGAFRRKRDANGGIIYLRDPETDEVLLDGRGFPRADWTIASTQARPETVFSAQDQDVVRLKKVIVTDKAFEKAMSEGRVLPYEFIAKTGGTAQGKIVWVEDKSPDSLAKAIGKIMITEQSDPDMNSAMIAAKGIMAIKGGPNSHTMIVASEYQLIAMTGIPDVTMEQLKEAIPEGTEVTIDAERGKILLGMDHQLTVAGNDFNVRDIPDSEGIRSATIVATVPKAFTQWVLSKIPSYKGIGLERLEIALAAIGVYPDLLLEYDNTVRKLNGEQVDGPTLDIGNETAEVRIAEKIAEMIISAHNDGRGFDHDLFKQWLRRVGKSESDLTWDESSGYKTIEDYYVSVLNSWLQNTDAYLFRYVQELTAGYNSGEDFYISILAEWLQATAETLNAPKEEVVFRAQQIGDAALRLRTLELVDHYYEVGLGDQETLEQLKRLYADLDKPWKIFARKDRRILGEVIGLLDKRLYIRLDDRKSDEYNNVRGAERYVNDERNPMKGMRGLDLLLAHPETLRWQLEAIRRVAATKRSKLAVFAPVVRRPEDVAALLRHMDAAGLTKDMVKRGIMTEIPTNSINIEDFLDQGIDFISTGGNDGLQTIGKIDRNTSHAWLKNAVTAYSPSVLRWNARIVKVIRDYNKKHGTHIESGFCGNDPSVRGQENYGVILRNMGYDSVSVVIEAYEKVATNLTKRGFKVPRHAKEAVGFDFIIDRGAESYARPVDYDQINIAGVRMGFGVHYRAMDRADYEARLEQALEAAAIESGRRGRSLVIGTDDGLSIDYRGLSRGAEFETTEANPDFGSHGLAKGLNVDKDFFRLDLEVIARVAARHANVKLVLKGVRNYEEVDRAMAVLGDLGLAPVYGRFRQWMVGLFNGPVWRWLMRALGVRGTTAMPIGLDVQVSGNVYEMKELLAPVRNISFISISNSKQLTSEFMTLEQDNTNGAVIKPSDVLYQTNRPVKVLATAARRAGVPFYLDQRTPGTTVNGLPDSPSASSVGSWFAGEDYRKSFRGAALTEFVIPVALGLAAFFLSPVEFRLGNTLLAATLAVALPHLLDDRLLGDRGLGFIYNNFPALRGLFNEDGDLFGRAELNRFVFMLSAMTGSVSAMLGGALSAVSVAARLGDVALAQAMVPGTTILVVALLLLVIPLFHWVINRGAPSQPRRGPSDSTVGRYKDQIHYMDDIWHAVYSRNETLGTRMPIDVFAMQRAYDQAQSNLVYADLVSLYQGLPVLLPREFKMTDAQMEFLRLARLPFENNENLRLALERFKALGAREQRKEFPRFAAETMWTVGAAFAMEALGQSADGEPLDAKQARAARLSFDATFAARFLLMMQESLTGKATTAVDARNFLDIMERGFGAVQFPENNAAQSKFPVKTGDLYVQEIAKTVPGRDPLGADQLRHLATAIRQGQEILFITMESEPIAPATISAIKDQLRAALGGELPPALEDLAGLVVQAKLDPDGNLFSAASGRLNPVSLYQKYEKADGRAKRRMTIAAADLSHWDWELLRDSDYYKTTGEAWITLVVYLAATDKTVVISREMAESLEKLRRILESA